MNMYLKRQNCIQGMYSDESVIRDEISLQSSQTLDKRPDYLGIYKDRHMICQIRRRAMWDPQWKAVRPFGPTAALLLRLLLCPVVAQSYNTTNATTGHNNATWTETDGSGTAEYSETSTETDGSGSTGWDYSQSGWDDSQSGWDNSHSGWAYDLSGSSRLTM